MKRSYTGGISNNQLFLLFLFYGECISRDVLKWQLIPASFCACQFSLISVAAGRERVTFTAPHALAAVFRSLTTAWTESSCSTVWNASGSLLLEAIRWSRFCSLMLRFFRDLQNWNLGSTLKATSLVLLFALKTPKRKRTKWKLTWTDLYGVSRGSVFTCRGMAVITLNY